MKKITTGHLPREQGAAYKILEHAFVQSPLGRTALPQLVVVVVKTLPVCPELLKARLVDVLDPAQKPLC
jgi:hypothetical protein